MFKTQKQRIVNGKALIVTVDRSKDKHFGYWRCPDGTDVKPFSFLNNGAGFSIFLERISRAKEIHHLDEIVFGYESTSPYGEALVHFMKARGVRIMQVNPMHTKRVKDGRAFQLSSADPYRAMRGLPYILFPFFPCWILCDLVLAAS
jgi:transposase